MLNYGADINIYSKGKKGIYLGGTPLAYAINALDVNNVTRLLERGANLNMCAFFEDENGKIDYQNAAVYTTKKYFSHLHTISKEKELRFKILAVLSKHGAKISMDYLTSLNDRH